MNKYQKTPEIIVDLHGYTSQKAKNLLDKIFAEGRYSHLRVITGKCAYREHDPVLAPFVKSYLQKKNIKFNPAKIQDGGEGALEVFP